MSIDLQSNGLRKQAEDVALIRVEELYPFPEAALRNVLANYPRVREVIWVQEEPKNMGAWKYMFPRVSALLEPKIKLNAVARPESSSPATGFAELYQAEQDRLIQSALGSTIKEVGGSKHGR
jgi:2-oxoglutarate dehydrogenase E1 component